MIKVDRERSACLDMWDRRGKEKEKERKKDKSRWKSSSYLDHSAGSAIEKEMRRWWLTRSSPSFLPHPPVSMPFEGL